LKYEQEMCLIIVEMRQHCVRGRRVQRSGFLILISHFIIPLTARSHVHGFLWICMLLEKAKVIYSNSKSS